MPVTPPNSASPPAADTAQPKTATRGEELALEDFYYDGPYLVFTAAYHLKRGTCCNSGCRHCPYRDSA
jgi:Family of unknown function (DUF5522)